MAFMRAYREDATAWVLAPGGRRLPDLRRRHFAWLRVSFTSRTDLVEQVQAAARHWWRDPDILVDASTIRTTTGEVPRHGAADHGLILSGSTRLALWGIHQHPAGACLDEHEPEPTPSGTRDPEAPVAPIPTKPA